METPKDSQLSSELQELYLENKGWLADVLFLEDETRFINKLMNDFFLPAIKQDHLKEMQAIRVKLQALEERRTDLKKLVEKNQQVLETSMSAPDNPTGLGLLDDSSRIQQEIKALFKADNSIKREIFALVEELMQKEKSTHLLAKE